MNKTRLNNMRVSIRRMLVQLHGKLKSADQRAIQNQEIDRVLGKTVVSNAVVSNAVVRADVRCIGCNHVMLNWAMHTPPICGDCAQTQCSTWKEEL